MSNYRVLAFAFLPVLAILGGWLLADSGPSAPRLVEIESTSGFDRGMPIAWTDRNIQLLRVDGAISEYRPEGIVRHRVLDELFVPANVMGMRGQLQREFGSGYSVEGGGNFAIVAPSDSVHLWVQRFSQLDRSFQQYFSTRGYPLRTAEFPLIGIVFPSQADFLQYAARSGDKLQPNTVGYYSVLSNRLYLYEMRGNAQAEGEALATVWHEAAHQLAFNRGIHQRLSAPPLWIMEGLASIFEAPGMMGPRSTLNSTDLINESRWNRWKKLTESPESTAQLFESMIRDDRPFRSQAADAYAIAWGISLYLAERETNHFIPYVQRLSQLPPGVAYPEEHRVQDFYRHFQSNPLLLIKSADRFLKGL